MSPKPVEAPPWRIQFVGNIPQHPHTFAHTRTHTLTRTYATLCDTRKQLLLHRRRPADKVSRIAVAVVVVDVVL